MARTKSQPTKELKPGDVVCQKICKDAVITEFTNLKDWTGQYCAVCMKVVPGSYQKIVPIKDKSKIASSANYQQPSKKEKSPKESPKETTIKEVADASEGKIVIATIPTHAPAPIMKSFTIADLLPTVFPDTINLSFVTDEGEVFYVGLKSNPEKTTQLLGAKQALIGKQANLEYLSISETGTPTNPVFKGLVK